MLLIIKVVQNSIIGSEVEASCYCTVFLLYYAIRWKVKDNFYEGRT